VEVHVPGLPEDPYGSQAVKELISKIHGAFPGVMVTIEDLIAEHDKVVASVMWRGPVVGGSQGGASPSAPLVAWPRLDVYRLFNGRIVEQWADRDDLAALHQLGIT
jgi:predicted ester cyclase